MHRGLGRRASARKLHAERRPVAIRNVDEATGNLGRMRSPARTMHLLEDTPAGTAVRERLGKEFTEAMKREWHTLGIHLGYRYDDFADRRARRHAEAAA